VQLGPLGTAAANRPIGPAPGDYDDGEIGRMMIGRGNMFNFSSMFNFSFCLTSFNLCFGCSVFYSS
jgi:hypothetical protein